LANIAAVKTVTLTESSGHTAQMQIPAKYMLVLPQQYQCHLFIALKIEEVISRISSMWGAVLCSLWYGFYR